MALPGLVLKMAVHLGLYAVMTGSPKVLKVYRDSHQLFSATSLVTKELAAV